MNEFSELGVPVDLTRKPRRVLTSASSRHVLSDEDVIIFADPAKMFKILMDEIAENKNWNRHWKQDLRTAKQELADAKFEVTARTTVVTPNTKVFPRIDARYRVEQKTVRKGIFLRRTIVDVPKISFGNDLARAMTLFKSGATFIPVAVSKEHANDVQTLIGSAIPPQSVRSTYYLPQQVRGAIGDAYKSGNLDQKFVEFLKSKQNVFEQSRTTTKQLMAAYDYLVNQKVGQEHTLVRTFKRFEDRLNQLREHENRLDEPGIAFIGLYHQIFEDMVSRLDDMEKKVGRGLNIDWRKGAVAAADASREFFAKYLNEIATERQSTKYSTDIRIVDQALTDPAGKKTDWFGAVPPPPPPPPPPPSDSKAGRGGMVLKRTFSSDYAEDEKKKMQQREAEAIEIERKKQETKKMELEEVQRQVSAHLSLMDLQEHVRQRRQGREQGMGRERGLGLSM